MMTSYEYKREAFSYLACDETEEYPEWVQKKVNALAQEGWRVLQIEEDDQGSSKEVDVFVWLEREIPRVKVAPGMTDDELSRALEGPGTEGRKRWTKKELRDELVGPGVKS